MKRIGARWYAEGRLEKCNEKEADAAAPKPHEASHLLFTHFLSRLVFKRDERSSYSKPAEKDG